jgi:nicotinate-nucleotide--dimethylbenzimidazole phosphoribosyltransferase
LAARAEGLGVGWVTLFRPDELAAMLDLPAGVDTLGWLCVGWPDERPPEPGLARAGWSIRQPLDDVVIQERWPTAGPPPPVSKVRAPGPESVVGVRDGTDDLLTPPGSLGVLDRAVDRLTALGMTARSPVSAVIAGADHPVASYGVSTFADSVTREVLEATVAGESLGATTARLIGADLVIVDAGVRGAAVSGALSIRPLVDPGDLVTSDALPVPEARRLVAAARRLGLGLSPGLVALGEVGIGNTTVAAALGAAQLGLDVPEVLGLGVGGDSATLERKGTAIREALSRARSEHGSHLSDPLTALAALGGPEIAVLAGVALGAAEAGCLVVLDGLATSVAAVAAVGLEPAAAAHLVAGQRSRERAHERVLSYLGIEPLLTLRLRAGEGVGAMLAVQIVLTAATVRRDVGRVVSEPAGDGRVTR